MALSMRIAIIREYHLLLNNVEISDITSSEIPWKWLWEFDTCCWFGEPCAAGEPVQKCTVGRRWGRSHYLNGPFCSITTNSARCMLLRWVKTVRSNYLCSSWHQERGRNLRFLWGSVELRAIDRLRFHITTAAANPRLGAMDRPQAENNRQGFSHGK